MENRPVPTSCRPTTTTHVANHSGPLSLCTKETIPVEDSYRRLFPQQVKVALQSDQILHHFRRQPVVDGDYDGEDDDNNYVDDDDDFDCDQDYGY